MATPSCQLCTQPSVYYCTCQNPSIYCCHACSYVHVRVSGEHNWVIFGKGERGKDLCKECERKPAEFMCCCEVPVKMLCSECKERHEIMRDGHFLLGASKAAFIQSQANLDHCQMIKLRCVRIDDYLNYNIGLVEQFKAQTEAFAEALIAQVNEQKDNTLKRANDFIAEIKKQRKELKEKVKELMFEQEKERELRLVKVALDVEEQFAYESDLFQARLCGEYAIRNFIEEFHEPQVIKEPTINQPDEKALSDLQPAETTASMDLNSSSQGVVEAPPSSSSSPPSGLVLAGSVIEVSEELKVVVHAPCREDFEHRIEEIPITIGRHRLPISTLQNAFKWNKVMVSKFQQLGDKYSSWRRCRGDGNCFYRCVGVLLCEHYCRPDTQAMELYQLWKAMMDQTPPYTVFAQDQKNLGSIKMWMKALKDLYEARCKGENALQKLQYYLQIPRVDKAIVTAMRNYTASCFKLAAETSEIQDFLPEGPEPVLREIISEGIEAEGVSLMFTARALKVVLHIITVNNTAANITETIYGPAESGWYPALHLLHLPGHYQILIPNQWEEADKYDFVFNTYSPIETRRIVDFEEYQPST